MNLQTTPQGDLILTVDSLNAGKSLRQYLGTTGRFSQGMIRRLKAHGCLSVNGEPSRLDRTLLAGDVIRVSWKKPDGSECFTEGLGTGDPDWRSLRVVLEDPHLLVVEKPAGVVLHPAREYIGDTLSDRVAAYLRNQGHRAPSIHSINRLDKDTTGLVLFAKDPWVAYHLTEAMQARQIHRAYVAIVTGHLEPPDGTISLPIGRVEGHPVKRQVVEGGGRAVTHYQTLAYWPAHSLVQLQLETGRTHQIRVHLSHLGHPLLGDTLYGEENCVEDTGGPVSGDPIYVRQALHAFRLAFVHPVTHQMIELEAPWPEDFRQMAERLAEPIPRSHLFRRF